MVRGSSMEWLLDRSGNFDHFNMRARVFHLVDHVQKIKHTVGIMFLLPWVKGNECSIKMSALDFVNFGTVHGGHLAIVIFRLTLPMPIVQITCVINYVLACFDDKSNTAVG